MQNILAQRLTSIRSWLKQHQYDALIVPHEDEYLGEYLPSHNERLQWLTGFTGSAGLAIITQQTAAIFVDGRYTVQVRKQTPNSLFEYHHLLNEPALDWLLETMPIGGTIAFDPRMHSASWLTQAQAKITAKNWQLKAIEHNPIDQLWDDRPAIIHSTMRLMNDDFSGQSCQSKRQEIADIIKSQAADCAILTDLASIAWLLNIRALDVNCFPIVLAHAIIHADSSVDFFFDQQRLPATFNQHVGNDKTQEPSVRLHAPATLANYLATMANKRVIFDPVNSNAWFYLALQQHKAELINAADPCLLPKSRKNSTEVAGMKACHLRDGVAMSKFLCWLDNQVTQGILHDEGILADKLEYYRRQDPSLVDLSFETISAAGSNAAMCHYHHTNQPKPSKLTLNSLYLVDSGAQYPDGTTDITRTIAIGQPTQEMIDQFTLVLKGHIALATVRFPKGTCGHQLDILARQYLWANGFDYDHGTGHGVGHFLSVHEGPQRIAKAVNNTPLQVGMIQSNEPGYYRDGAFGIRIENLELVVDIETQGDFSVLGFESLTRCPIDKRNINVEMLTRSELTWLNNYHQNVWNEIAPLIEQEEVKQWLKQATSPLSYSNNC